MSLVPDWVGGSVCSSLVLGLTDKPPVFDMAPDSPSDVEAAGGLCVSKKLSLEVDPTQHDKWAGK